MSRAVLGVFWCFLVFTISGCGQQEEGKAPSSKAVSQMDLTPSESDIAFAEDAMPMDVALAEKYDRSCRSCHSMVDAEAPLTGHVAAWEERYQDKGLEGLLETSKTGIGTMPAKGLCPDCSDADLTALIEFMAGRGK